MPHGVTVWKFQIGRRVKANRSCIRLCLRELQLSASVVLERLRAETRKPHRGVVYALDGGTQAIRRCRAVETRMVRSVFVSMSEVSDIMVPVPISVRCERTCNRRLRPHSAGRRRSVGSAGDRLLGSRVIFVPPLGPLVRGRAIEQQELAHARAACSRRDACHSSSIELCADPSAGHVARIGA